jgi:predicted Rossmann fold nucleotide-binding protein DprA/Smf involved in DNA uptake
VPGPIDDSRAAGANALIRDGAQVVASVDDLLGLYGLSTPWGAGGPEAGLDPADQNLLALVGEEGSDAERIAQISRTPLRHVLSRLSDLELKGRLIRNGDRYLLAGRR